MEREVDRLLKDFWEDNDRFADLFNAVLFNGRLKVAPDKLKEVQRDLSGVKPAGRELRMVMNANKIHKTDGRSEYVIWNIDINSGQNFLEPVAMRVFELLSYLEQKKNNKLKPITTLAIYYDKTEWIDIISPPDYKLNLVEVNRSEGYHFTNKDVALLFEGIRAVYMDTWDTFVEKHNKQMDKEISLLISSITKKN